MPDFATVVPLSILICSLLVFNSREAHKLRRGIVAVASTILLAASLVHPNIKVASALLIIGSLFSLAPIAILKDDNEQGLKLHKVIAYQLLGYIFFYFAVYDSSFTVFLALSLALRLILPFCAPTLVNTIQLMPGSKRSLFYLSSFTFALFVMMRLLPSLTTQEQLCCDVAFMAPAAFCLWNFFKVGNTREGQLYISQALSLLPLTFSHYWPPTILAILASITASAITILGQNSQAVATKSMKSFELDIWLYEGMHAVFYRASVLSRRAIGPIVIEWGFFGVAASALVGLRLFSRFLTFASFQRVLATSLLVSFVMLIYIMRL